MNSTQLAKNRSLAERFLTGFQAGNKKAGSKMSLLRKVFTYLAGCDPGFG
jgi:hypothetical protein